MPEIRSHDVIFAPAALADLEEIASYLVTELGEGEAEELLTRLRDKCQSLSAMPLRFPLAGSEKHSLRRCQSDAWHIFYTFDSHVEIVRVIHQSRDVSALMAANSS